MDKESRDLLKIWAKSNLRGSKGEFLETNKKSFMVECLITYIPNFTTINQYSRNGEFGGRGGRELWQMDEMNMRIPFVTRFMFQHVFNMSPGTIPWKFVCLFPEKSIYYTATNFCLEILINIWFIYPLTHELNFISYLTSIVQNGFIKHFVDLQSRSFMLPHENRRRIKSLNLFEKCVCKLVLRLLWIMACLIWHFYLGPSVLFFHQVLGDINKNCRKLRYK